MRPGPSLEVLSGAVAVGARVDIVRGGRVLAVDVPARNVKVEWTKQREVPSRLSYTVDAASWMPNEPLDPLNNFGQVSRVVSVIESEGAVWEVEIGYFLHTGWEENADGGVDVVAADLLQRLEENPMTWPSSPPYGATLGSEIKRLAEGVPVVLDIPDESISRNFQWGTDRLESLGDLCEARGLSFAVKSDGALHVWRSPNGFRPVETYSGEDLLVDSPVAGLPRRPNRWVVTATPEGDENAKWTAVRTLASSPYEPQAYGVVTDRREFDVATNAAAVEAAADTYMRNAANSEAVRSLEVVLDPRLEVGDQVCVHTGPDVMVLGTVQALVMDLDGPEQTMRVDVMEVKG